MTSKVVSRHSTTSISFLADRVLTTFRSPTFVVSAILPRPAALATLTATLDDLGSIAARTRTPFAYLTVVGKTNMAEQLSAFVAGFSDLHVVLRE